MKQVEFGVRCAVESGPEKKAKRVFEGGRIYEHWSASEEREAPNLGAGGGSGL